MRIFLFFYAVSLFSCICTSKSEEFFLAAPASSTTNAFSSDFFNNPENWSSPVKMPGKIGPGDNIHVTGIISTPFQFQASGTTNSPISLIFERDAKFSTAAWTSSGAIVLNNKSNLIIDGGTNGTIENTENGTLLKYQVTDSVGILAENPSNLIVKNLRISNLYVRTKGEDQMGGKSWGIAIRSYLGSTQGILVTNCVINDVGAGILAEYSSNSSRYHFSNVTISNCNTGISIADRNSSSGIRGIVIEHSNFLGYSNWDDTSPINTFHHNSIFIWSVQGGSSFVDDIKINSNTFGPGASGLHQTSYVFFQGAVRNILLYNNTLKCNEAEFASNGLLFLNTTAPGELEIFNNSFESGGPGTCIGVSDSSANRLIDCRNNYAKSVGGGTFVAIYNATTNLTIKSDKNVLFNFSAKPFSLSSSASLSSKSLSEWRSFGFDLASVAYIGSQMNSYLLSKKGYNLYDFFTVDKYNNSRTNTGAWDIGATLVPITPNNFGKR